jgi:Na+/H+ antiporter NhaD/arsenite permease-like protein
MVPAYPAATAEAEAQYAAFPKPVSTYSDAQLPLLERIQQRATAEPFNLIVTILFACAILHTFLAPVLLRYSHVVEKRFKAKLTEAEKHKVSAWANILEFLGEVEVVFALWALPVLLVAFNYFGWDHVVSFMHHDSNFTEPMFVIVIMAMAATRPVVQFAEQCLNVVARMGKGTPTAWWFAILTLAPLLGSVITEPGAMTIGALLLGRKIYELKPGAAFKYATLGLLFVNISVGGVLTNFAAPPVLMVAGRWNWSSLDMLQMFGWRSVLAIVANNLLYWIVFRKQLKALETEAELEKTQKPAIAWVDSHAPVPVLVTLLHLAFLAWTVVVAHYPAMFIGGYLFFLAVVQTTGTHQSKSSFRGPLMVGLFLAGLVIHGRLQAWWLEPVLNSGLSEWTLHLGSATLTAFNDNALITFLASQVQGLSDGAKYAIMSGAIAGGGLTVIANAPNPAGQSLLKRYFPNGVSPLGLLLGAFVPTLIVIACYMLTR